MNLERVRLGVALMWLFGALAPAYANDLIVGTFHLDRVRHPKDGPQTIQECLNNPICNSAVSAAAIAMGVSPNTLKVFSAAAKIFPLGNEGDDEMKFDWWAPDGYQLCKLSIDVVSTVPAGQSGSLLDVSFEQRKNHIVTYVPIQNFGGGKAWVEANMVATYVSDSSADAHRANGTCQGFNQGSLPPWVYRCRGRVGDNQGRQPCGSLRY